MGAVVGRIEAGLSRREVLVARAKGAGGVGRRALALVVDLILIWLLLEIGVFLSELLARRDLVATAFRMTCFLVVPAAYFGVCQGAVAQTLGKWLVGVCVVGPDGGPVSYLRALARTAALFLTAPVWGVSAVVAILRPDKRGFHDLLARTRTIRVS